MKDILKREIHDNDLCIRMAIGRNSSGMHIGVAKGSQIISLNSKETGTQRSTCSNVYLIANPTEQELEIKLKILSLLNKEEEEKKERNSQKTIPLSQLEVGGIYEDTNGKYWLYLGEKDVFKYCIYASKKDCYDIQRGNCFVGMYIAKSENVKPIEICWFDNGWQGISVIKGNKKLIKLEKKLNIVFPIVFEKSTFFNKTYRIEIK